MKKNELKISVTENTKGCGYHYIIKNGWQSYTAFATRNGFKNFLKRNNLKLKLELKNDNFEGGWLKYYSCVSDGDLHEESFWNLSEIPEGAIKYKNLSNGSYVDCYYYNKGNDSYNYRPNPNAKEVYIPMTVEEHIEYSKING